MCDSKVQVNLGPLQDMAHNYRIYNYYGSQDNPEICSAILNNKFNVYLFLY